MRCAFTSVVRCSASGDKAVVVLTWSRDKRRSWAPLLPDFNSAQPQCLLTLSGELRKSEQLCDLWKTTCASGCWALHLQDEDLLFAKSLLPHQRSTPGIIIMCPCPTFDSRLPQLARSAGLLAKSAVLQTSQNTVGSGPALYRWEMFLGSPIQISLLKQCSCSLSKEKKWALKRVI